MEYNRLLWASRRGMLELDLILMPFLENRFNTLADEEKEAYRRLLECEDQDLYAWLMNHRDPEEERLLKIVEIIRVNTRIQPRA